MKKLLLSLLLTATTLPTLANEFYLVVPVKGKAAAKPAVPDIRVTLNAASLPDAKTASLYSYDLKQNLIVTGDSSYSGQGVAWSVASGALPAGLTLNSATGVLSGTPSQGGTATFTVTASYKTKSGLQAYQLIVVQGLNKITNAGLTFVLPSLAMKDFPGANAQCGAPIDGQTGWRLPTSAEVSALYNAKGTAPIAALGWPTDIADWYWTTDEYRGGVYIVWKPYNSGQSICGWADVCARAICVK